MPVWISSPSGKFNCTSATWEQLRHKENEVPMVEVDHMVPWLKLFQDMGVLAG